MFIYRAVAGILLREGRAALANFLAQTLRFISVHPSRSAAKKVGYSFPDCCFHYGTVAAYDSLHPATRYPEASHANYCASRFSFSEAEGSAPLDHRVMTNCLDDGWP